MYREVKQTSYLTKQAQDFSINYAKLMFSIISWNDYSIYLLKLLITQLM